MHSTLQLPPSLCVASHPQSTCPRESAWALGPGVLVAGVRQHHQGRGKGQGSVAGSQPEHPAPSTCCRSLPRRGGGGWGAGGGLPPAQGVFALAVQAAAGANGEPEKGAEQHRVHLEGGGVSFGTSSPRGGVPCPPRKALGPAGLSVVWVRQPGRHCPLPDGLPGVCSLPSGSQCTGSPAGPRGR